ncbi:MAG: chemotaxis protein [Afipia felis]|nr:chemotaxis protein [Afipia felis]
MASHSSSREAIASVEEVSSNIEATFAEVGGHLGRGHSIFNGLNDSLTALSLELSGAKIEGAADALQSIATRLTDLSRVLPEESALLKTIGADASQASSVLAPLIKHIEMILIIARSARIEAASFDADRESFLDFTQEAIDLAKAAKSSVEACRSEQQRLCDAVGIALTRQQTFEARYQPQLLSVSSALAAGYSSMQSHQNESVQLADLTGKSTRQMADSVSAAIISLQAGDSVRQRLEHICRGLRIVSGDGIAPGAMHGLEVPPPAASLVCHLQAAHLQSTSTDFQEDITGVDRSLASLLEGVAEIMSRGRAMCGGDGSGMASFLSGVKQALEQASLLIETCESSRQSVDDALSVVDDTLGKFRVAISQLSEVIVDITLIGMNAGLKASHLGTKGRAFVVIAGELKVAADQISGGAGILRPVLDGIEKFAAKLKVLRAESDPSAMARLEPVVVAAMAEIEAGNDQLERLMSRLVVEGGEFERMMTHARSLLATIGTKVAVFPNMAGSLEGQTIPFISPHERAGIAPLFDDLHAQYTMVSERDVHANFAKRLGLVVKESPSSAASDDADEVLFF